MPSINPTNTVAALNDKLPWEDPSMVLERDLIARAQGGPPSSEPQQPWQQALVPMGISNGNCL